MLRLGVSQDYLENSREARIYLNGGRRMTGCADLDTLPTWVSDISRLVTDGGRQTSLRLDCAECRVISSFFSVWLFPTIARCWACNLIGHECGSITRTFCPLMV